MVRFLTVERASAACADCLLGEALGGSPLAVATCVRLGLNVTALTIQGVQV